MVYASLATGYKGAGYDVSIGFDRSRIDRPVTPETAKAYELGVKSRFLQNRVQLNATAFLTDYKDFQAQSPVIEPNTQLPQNAINNVGETHSRCGARTHGQAIQHAVAGEFPGLYRCEDYLVPQCRLLPRANACPRLRPAR